MFFTPPRSSAMVNTLSIVRNEKQLKSEGQQQTGVVLDDEEKSIIMDSEKPGTSGHINVEVGKSTSQHKKRNEHTSVSKIYITDLAAVEEKYSPIASECSSQEDDQKIEEWLQRSQQEMEKQKANNNGTMKGSMFPPPDGLDGTNGPIQQLASVLKDLVTTSQSTSQNANLLSRISTSKELPIFYCDPME
ncbi:hypothetical protein ACJJTC_011765 [Scirpophaga incertulas]